MKILAKVFAVSLITTQALAGYRTGDDKYLGQEYWLPKNVCASFYYKDGETEGYEVKFTAGKTDLFTKWKIVDDNGDAHPYPFVLEITLIVFEQFVGGMEYTGKKRGTDWDFTSQNQCMGDIVYRDTPLFDSLEQTDKFGIGILEPHSVINEGNGYSYFIKLRRQDNLSELNHNTKVQLRFRLGIDVWKMHKWNYDPWSDSKVISNCLNSLS